MHVPQPARLVAHVDMDAFFASIETRDHPQWQGKPLIVAGHTNDRRGVVSTANYEARRFGVHSAQPLAQARRLCPAARVVNVDIAHYTAVSDQVFNLLRRFTPLVEPVSIDEAFLDLSAHPLAEQPAELGQAIKTAIRTQLGLTASVGLAPNKALAKIASDWNKPDGLLVIRPDQVDSFLLQLPLEKIWGIGPKTLARLRQAGIDSVARLRQLDAGALQLLLGKSSLFLYDLVRGIDRRPVEPRSPAKSVGRELTFAHDIRGRQAATQVLADLSRAVAARLRQVGQSGRSLSLKARYPDFVTIERSQTVPCPLQDPRDMYALACLLLAQLPRPNGPFRLLGLTVSGLSPYEQLPLFEPLRQPPPAPAVTATRAVSPGRSYCEHKGTAPAPAPPAPRG
ncbi:MAG: DNA polymerase IV [Limnochordaceae bacterium]|nr:DNA polymerase IV [Limnochordaceae bacterium]